MDIKRIEPLLMDHALGATTPEVAALVEAYQETNPQLRAQLEQWRGVAEVARQALQGREPVGLPIFPRRRLQSARRVARWRCAAILSVALAACLLLGFFAGTQVRDRTGPPAMSGNVPVAAVENFWSQARLRSIAEQNAAQTARSPGSSLRNPSVLLKQFGG